VSSRRRLGVALLIDPPRSDEIDGLRRALGDRALARIAPHVTLVAPVNVKDDSLPSTLALIRSAAVECGRPLQLTLGPPATWLPANPVLYLPVGGDLPELRRLREAVFVPPLERSLAWPWVPHVTLADDVESSRIGAAIEALGGYQVAVTIDRIVLLELRHPSASPPASAPASPPGGSSGGSSGGGPYTPTSSRSPAAAWPPAGRRWVPIADAALAPALVVGRGGVELTLVQGRLLGPDALALLAAAGVVPGAGGSSGSAGGEAGFAGEAGFLAGEAGPFAGDHHASAIVLSALVEGDLVGLARAWRSDAGGHIAVFVAPGHRRSGIGRQLIRRTEDAVRRGGWTCPVLRAVGPAAFYRACSDWSTPATAEA
jgi:2'-5' RNA ligase/GNAT superfamily N-acetyltransferase